jgi:hypothetical protein
VERARPTDHEAILKIAEGLPDQRNQADNPGCAAEIRLRLTITAGEEAAKAD